MASARASLKEAGHAAPVAEVVPLTPPIRHLGVVAGRALPYVVALHLAMLGGSLVASRAAPDSPRGSGGAISVALRAGFARVELAGVGSRRDGARRIVQLDPKLRGWGRIGAVYLAENARTIRLQLYWGGRLAVVDPVRYKAVLAGAIRRARLRNNAALDRLAATYARRLGRLTAVRP